MKLNLDPGCRSCFDVWIELLKRKRMFVWKEASYAAVGMTNQLHRPL